MISLFHVFHMPRHIHAWRKIFWQVHQFEFHYKCITKNRFSDQKLFFKEMRLLIFLSRVKFSRATISDLFYLLKIVLFLVKCRGAAFAVWWHDRSNMSINSVLLLYFFVNIGCELTYVYVLALFIQNLTQVYFLYKKN